MAEPGEAKQAKVIKIGPDRVTIAETEIVIETRHAMADWEVQEINPVPIYFEDKKYYLVEQRKGSPPYAMRYLLKPWPEGHISASKRFHAYDAETVAERDSGRRSGQLDEVIRACLLPFYPFLGLLWSGAQRRLMRFGFVPHSITGISVFTVFAAIFAQGVFTSVMINASARSGKIMIGGVIRAMASQDHLRLGPIAIPIGVLDALFFLACVADLGIRYNHYLREDQWYGGFLEWLMPQRWRKKVE
jgi:hypothetical protein